MATVITEPSTLALSDMLCEVIAGRLVEKARLDTDSELLANDLGNALGLYLARNPIGRSYMHMLIDFTERVGNSRRPEVCFVSERRWPRRKRLPSTDAWQVVPELAVEFVSPSTTASEVADKTAEYFQSGVSEVWIVLPKQSLIYRYTSLTDLRIFKLGDRLMTELLPGFQLPLSELFATDEDQ